jgi:hypothetical protein
MSYDPIGTDLLIKVGFTLIVFCAILAVLTETYAEAVLAATLLAVIWQLVTVFGVSLFLATVLILAGLGLRLGLAALGGFLGADAAGIQFRARLLEDLFTDRDRRNREE